VPQKLHLGVSHLLLTEPLAELLSEDEDEAAEVLTNGAYDFRGCYKAIARRARAQPSRQRSLRESGAGRSSQPRRGRLTKVGGWQG
jgi:hypothetical protein